MDFSTKDFSPLGLEVATLDLIHALLDRPEHSAGLPVGSIAREIGVAVGYVNQILKRSTSVLKRRGLRWYVDWSDLQDWEQSRSQPDWTRAVFKRGDDSSLVRVLNGKVNVIPNALKRRHEKIQNNGREGSPQTHRFPR